MSISGKVYKEVYEVLKLITEEERKKVPGQMIQLIETKMDREYNFTIKDMESLTENDLLNDTKAILAVMYRDYWATEEERKEIFEQDKKELEELQEKYNPNNLFKKDNKNSIEDSNVTEKSLVKYNDNIFKKIFNKLKKLFRR